ncbi:MAG: hypothetical protein IPL21_03375 [Saprospirales bacterium]|nr:hypothetical protein [Saprospirales bacterium]
MNDALIEESRLKEDSTWESLPRIQKILILRKVRILQRLQLLLIRLLDVAENKNAIPYFSITDDEVSTPTSVITYVTGTLFYCVAVLKLFSGLENKMDIQFADEAAYIRFGLDLYGKLNRDWGEL